MGTNNTSSKGRRRGVLDVFLASQTSLRGFIARFMVSSDEIDDIAQEAFLRAYKAEQTTVIDQPKAFLFKVAKNLMLSEFGRTGRKVTDYVDDIETLDCLPEGESLEANVIAQQRLGIYCEAIATLPVQCRRVMIMKKLYGLPTKEVARRLGITTSTVEKHMTKALKDCNAILAARYQEVDALAPAVTNPVSTLKRSGRVQ